MNFFSSAKSLRLMAAAGVVAFYCGAGPALATTYTYPGDNDPLTNGEIYYDYTGNYTLDAADEVIATGGNVTVSGKVGGEGFRVRGSYENNGVTNVIGGSGTRTSSSTGLFGGVGITVEGTYTNNGTTVAIGGKATAGNSSRIDGGNALVVIGDIYNYGDMEATGGEATLNAMGSNGGWSQGGVGVYSAAGHFYNHGKLRANGGTSPTDNSFAGSGIEVAAFSNYSHDVIAIGGNGTTTGNGALDAVGGHAIVINGDFYNEGTIEGRGGDATIGCIHHAKGGDGLRAAGKIENRGTLKGYGGTGDSSGGTGTATPGAGMRLAGLTENYGTIYAEGGKGPKASGTNNATVEGGVGMIFDGGLINYSDNFTAIGGLGSNTTSNGIGQGGAGATVAVVFENHGAITAKGGAAEATGAGKAIGGEGLTVTSGMTNRGTIIAKGGNANATGAGDATGAAGMSVTGGSFNYDVMVAQGGLKENGGGTGIETAGVGITFNDGLTNYKDSFLTLLGHGGATTDAGAAAVALGGAIGSDPELPYGAYFRLGSYLALGSADVATGQNSGAYIDANGMDVVFEKEASGDIPVSAVISLVASSTSVGDGSVTHTGFVTNTSSTLASANLASYEGPVMKVTFSENVNATTPGNNDFTFTAERVGLSSEKTTGAASDMLANWEKDLLGQPITASNYDWANLLASVDFQPTFEEIQKDADDILDGAMNMPVANNQAIQSLARAARYVDGMFSHNMQSLAKCRQAKACNYNENAYDGRTAGLVCGVSTDPLMIWAQPFYYDGRQKGKRANYHTFDETYYGVTAGVAYDADFAILSAEVHYYQGDLKTRNYKGDVDAFGFELGIGRCFNIANNINPWVEIRAGYTWMEVDQKRTDLNGIKATSKPDAGVWTGGITVNNAFSMTEQIKITPHIGVDLMHVDMDSYSEKNSTLATKVSPKDYTSVQGTIGVQVDYNPTDNLFLEARAAYHYEFADTKADAVARGVGLTSNLKVPGDEISRSSASFGAGVGVKLTDNVSVRADYDVHLADRYVGHQVSATLSFTF